MNNMKYIMDVCMFMCFFVLYVVGNSCNEQHSIFRLKLKRTFKII